MFHLRSIPFSLAFAAALLAQPSASLAQQRPRNQERREQRADRPKAGEWLRKYRNVPPQEQEKALNNDPQFKSLPAERQERLKQRLQQFNSLPPQRQEQVINRMQQFDRLTPEQRDEARSLQQRVKDIPPDRRRQMRIVMRHMREMSPEDREREMNSREFHSRFDDNERDIMQRTLRLPIGPGAEEAQPQ